MKTILVTGANGYLASYCRLLNSHNFNWICMTRKDADLSDPASVKKYLETVKFDICQRHNGALRREPGDGSQDQCGKHADDH